MRLPTSYAPPTIDIGGRVSAAHQRHRRTSDRNNNRHDIYPQNTQRAQRAAILLPSFRSPRLCNYDFIFMDINYTGRLAVSLYGILIQGCRHNGNPRHTELTHCSPARKWGKEPVGGHWGGKRPIVVGYVEDFASCGSPALMCVFAASFAHWPLRRSSYTRAHTHMHILILFNFPRRGRIAK